MQRSKDIRLFLPLRYKKESFIPCQISDTIEKKYQYASYGRYAIIHILKSLEIFDGVILVSSYMCPTVGETLLKNGYSVDYYDIDPIDLNPDIRNIELMIKTINPKAVIVPSMYGNPADLIEAEKLGKKYSVAIIDDAAQSFGAMLNGRYVSSFGDGGFFAFLPGKPTSGHMGAYFCSKNTQYTFKRSRHRLYHYIKYLDYRWNRCYIYTNYFLKLTMLMRWIYPFLPINVQNDDCCKFELPIFGGILKYNNIAMSGYRKSYMERFIKKFDGNINFRIVKAQRGILNMHKFVIIFNDKLMADNFCEQMKQMKVFTYRGYSLPQTERDIPHCRNLIGKIVEIPLEDNCAYGVSVRLF